MKKIDGTFYEQELVFVPADDKREYKIEQILKYRTKNKRKEALVKWYGYNIKFNSWIPASTITKYRPSK